MVLPAFQRKMSRWCFPASKYHGRSLGLSQSAEAADTHPGGPFTLTDGRISTLLSPKGLK